MKIVITGNIASGKSTIVKWLKENPVDSCVIDADQVVHELYKTAELQKKLRQAFGHRVINQDNEVDRQFLGNLVFQDKTQLEKLNQVTQEPIRLALEHQITQLNKTHANVFIEATLAVERAWLSFFDYSLCVTCPDEIRTQRLILRNNLSPKDALSRINSQMPQAEKAKSCDFNIKNESSQKELIKELQKVLKQIGL